MSLDSLSITTINWPLFMLTSLIICLRVYIPSISIWFLNKFYSPSRSIDELTNELKTVTNELNILSPQDEFAAYSRKERKRNALRERLKDERKNVETRQKNLINIIRLIFNIGTVFIMIFLTIKGRRHDSKPLFNFPFFQCPLIVWVMALNAFFNTLTNMFLRYQTNKKSSEK